MATILDIIYDSEDAEEFIQRALDWFSEPVLSNEFGDIFDDVMTDAAANRFATESSNGIAWAPLKTTTVQRRIEQGFPGPHPINVRTGKMKSHILHSVPEGGATPDGAEFSWPEAAHGELYMKMLRAWGFDNRAGARPVVDFDENDMQALIEGATMNFERFVG